MGLNTLKFLEMNSKISLRTLVIAIIIITNKIIVSLCNPLLIIWIIKI